MKTAPTIEAEATFSQITKPSLPELFIVSSQGEVEVLRRRGFVATSRPRMAALEGVHAVLVPVWTNHRQMSEIASRLLGIAARIEILVLAGLLPGENLRIWFSAQSADDSDEEFAKSQRVEITSLEGISVYLGEPPYLAVTTPELARAFVALAAKVGWTPKEALEFVSSTLGGEA